MEHVANYEKVFEKDYTDTFVTSDGNIVSVPFHTKRIGELDLQSETCIDIHGLNVPAERISKQICPIDIAIAKHEVFQDRRENGEFPACVRIISKDTLPIRWEKAKGFIPTAKTDRFFSTVRVDSGMLQVAHPRYQETAQASSNFSKEVIELSEGDYWSKSSIEGYEAFDIQTAFGDGTFPIYAGYDKDGSVCRIVCDFVGIGLNPADIQKSINSNTLQ